MPNPVPSPRTSSRTQQLRTRATTHGVFLGLAATLLGSGCGDPPSARPRPATAKSSDKAALFADASLVPTREGERTRREIALAEEIRAAVELLHGVERARATVTLNERGDVEGASVVVRASTHADPVQLRATAEGIAHRTLAIDRDGTTLTVEISMPPNVTDTTTLPTGGTPTLPLMLALLGLGFSLGLTFDRSRRVVFSVWRSRAQGPDTRS